MTKIPVFYNDKQTATKNDSFSPSAGKPAKVMANWLASGIPIEQMDFKPLKRSHIALAHNPRYVADVLDGRRSNGFGNTLKEVNDTLPYTTGSFLHATLHALKTGKVAASLTSGFHHACYDNGGGFCTFNGLMITAQFLLLHGLVRKVGILDMDEHSGNGQENIIQHFNMRDRVSHWSLGYSGPTRYGAKKFFKKEFKKVLATNFADVDVLLFQAGADPWVNDPLGGRLTKEQLRMRDQMVFEFCAKRGIPVVWNLAGGYADQFQNVLDIHLNTLIEAAKAFGVADRSDLTNTDDGEVKKNMWESFDSRFNDHGSDDEEPLYRKQDLDLDKTHFVPEFNEQIGEEEILRYLREEDENEQEMILEHFMKNLQRG